MKIASVHEHAEYYPMLSDEQLEELADDIRKNGQRDPITVTPDGILIDGRNRLKACELVGIEPQIEVLDVEDVGAFVRSRNERRHQSTGSRAMSTALSLEHDGKRTVDKAGKGRWAQGSASFPNSGNSKTWSNAMNQAGTILDEINADHSNLDPQIAWDVVAGDIALDLAYKQACAERDRRATEEQQRKLEDEQAKERDKRAREFFADERNEKARAWFEERKDAFGDNMRAAFEAYKEFDDKLRAEEEKRRRELERQQREHEEARKRDAGRLRAFLDGWETAWAMREDPHREEVLNHLEPARRQRFLQIEKETTWPTERL